MNRIVLIYASCLAILATGCAQTHSGTDWDTIDYAGIHCQNASPDNKTCHPKDDLAVIGARSGKSK